MKRNLVNDPDQFNELCELAKLRFNESYAKKVRERLAALTNAFEILKEVEVGGAEPLLIPNEKARTRVDVVETFEARDLALKNAPELVGRLVKVPVVIS